MAKHKVAEDTSTRILVKYKKATDTTLPSPGYMTVHNSMYDLNSSRVINKYISFTHTTVQTCVARLVCQQDIYIFKLNLINTFSKDSLNCDIWAFIMLKKNISISKNAIRLNFLILSGRTFVNIHKCLLSIKSAY